MPVPSTRVPHDEAVAGPGRSVTRAAPALAFAAVVCLATYLALPRLLVDGLQQLAALGCRAAHRAAPLTVLDGNREPGRGIINREAVTEWDGPRATNLQLFSTDRYP